jgi:hypothetical protein
MARCHRPSLCAGTNARGRSRTFTNLDPMGDGTKIYSAQNPKAFSVILSCSLVPPGREDVTPLVGSRCEYGKT